MVKIAALGINVVDIYLQEGMMYPGGNEFNIAWHIHALGGESAFIGVFSEDKAGQILRSILIEEGIDISQSRTCSEGSCGYALVEFNDGDRVFVDWNKQGVTDQFPIAVTESLVTFLRSYDLTCISHNSRFVPEKVQALFDAGIKIAYDFSDFFHTTEMQELCPFLEVGFFSLSHEMDEAVVKHTLAEACKQGCKLAVGTLGSRGSLAFDSERYFFQPSIDRKRVDTMGAGDSFIAAFLTAFLDENVTVSNALLQATEYATKTIGFKGSLGFGYPIDREHIENYISL
ncbi:PfkB family carbohydrate kinase [uncultured Sphaerochaeta sp.]|uniref:PfkB family carbohydrate kinase n=1 Tax=uncultured Sphaerochaeta sp. TaxID=886478 RepID=UPI002A0A9E43|nr:PfkB family carbohydrate kinase [uncultured Sphaerochaeta sp.]